MPKILLKFVGFFPYFGVSSKMLLATLIASQQSASASPEATGSISPLIRHTYMLSPLLETLLRPHFSDKVEVMVQIRMDMAQPIEETALPAVFALTHPFSSDYIESAGLFCDSLPPLQMAAAIEQAPMSKARGGAANRCHRHSGVEEHAGNFDCLTVLALIPGDAARQY